MKKESETNYKEHICLSCADCALKSCMHKDTEHYPEFCLTKHVDKELLGQTKNLYIEDEENKKLALVAAEIEGQFYGRMTRVEETIEFIKRTGAKKVGIATCVGLLNEANIFAKILRSHGIDFYAVGCKIGAIEKSEIGIPKENTLTKGEKYESMCNPIMQAKILNEQKTDVNVMIGLCVGHDALFLKYVEAPTTVMIVKDRVTGHNPAVALYTSNSIYSKLKK